MKDVQVLILGGPAYHYQDAKDVYLNSTGTVLVIVYGDQTINIPIFQVIRYVITESKG